MKHEPIAGAVRCSALDVSRERVCIGQCPRSWRERWRQAERDGRRGLGARQRRHRGGGQSRGTGRDRATGRQSLVHRLPRRWPGAGQRPGHRRAYDVVHPLAHGHRRVSRHQSIGRGPVLLYAIGCRRHLRRSELRRSRPSAASFRPRHVRLRGRTRAGRPLALANRPRGRVPRDLGPRQPQGLRSGVAGERHPHVRRDQHERH